MKFRLVCLGGAFALALLSLAVAGAQQVPPTPPPPVSPSITQAPAAQLPVPATPAVSAPPTASPAPRGRGRARPAESPSPAASASETPAPPQFTTLDGVWEVELQTSGGKTIYYHWNLRQTGQAGADVSGTWDRGGKPDVKVSMNGSFDGRLFKFTATQGATQYTFTGYVENYSDIVGMMNDGKKDTAFTAQHRKKTKAINSIAPGGMPLPGPGAPR